jgi:hypothetical protein
LKGHCIEIPYHQPQFCIVLLSKLHQVISLQRSVVISKWGLNFGPTNSLLNSFVLSILLGDFSMLMWVILILLGLHLIKRYHDESLHKKIIHKRMFQIQQMIGVCERKLQITNSCNELQPPSWKMN